MKPKFRQYDIIYTFEHLMTIKTVLLKDILGGLLSGHQSKN